MNPLKSTSWLEENINNVKILDATWHMPNSNRNAFKEYQDNHIKNSIFFDLDKNSNQKIFLPHMLPELKEWEKIVSELGIKNNDHLIIYDNSDVLSASRCWFTFLYFGHDLNLVSVLDGGLKKWKLENRPLSKEKVNLIDTKYKATIKNNLVINLNQVEKNIEAEIRKLEAEEEQELMNGYSDQERDLNRKFPGLISHPLEAQIFDISIDYQSDYETECRKGGNVCSGHAYFRAVPPRPPPPFFRNLNPSQRGGKL